MAASRTRLFLLVAVVLVSGVAVKAEVHPIPAGGFVVTHELLLPGSPEIIFDAVTGDISGWWDHSLSETPQALYIEPKPVGGFYEIFDDEGNGVLHATVIYADRGKLLRFVGPLGFFGSALSLVTSYEFEPRADPQDSGLVRSDTQESRRIRAEVIAPECAAHDAATCAEFARMTDASEQITIL